MAIGVLLKPSLSYFAANMSDYISLLICTFVHETTDVKALTLGTGCK